MQLYILKRVLSIIPVLLIVAIVVFSLTHITPGDPASVILGPDAPPEMLEELRKDLGLHLPIYEQFSIWLSDVLRGDLGESIFMKKPVIEILGTYLGPTISLSLLAQFIAVVLAIPMGIIAATRKGTAVDQFLMIFALIGISVPSFLLGLFLILFFAVNLGWLPVAGYQALSAGFVEHVKYLILPALALGFMQAALITRMTRASMLEILNSNYIKTARSKGLREKVVVYKHALRNAFVTILEVVGQTFTTLIGGAFVVEAVFNIPGIGQLIVNSVERRDYVLIQGTVLLVAGVHVLINLLIDLLYGVVDPRVRLNKK